MTAQYIMADGNEAATSIAEQPDTQVALSYRSEAFTRAKLKNRNKVEQAQADGRLTVLLKSNVKEIGEHSVKLDHDTAGDKHSQHLFTRELGTRVNHQQIGQVYIRDAWLTPDQ